MCGFVVFTEAFHVESYLALCSNILSVMLGEERAGLYFSRAICSLSLHALLFSLFFLVQSGDGCGMCLWHSLDIF